MKTATIPPLRVDPQLRQSAENLLYEGETLSSFVIDSIKDSIKNRQLKKEFIDRGLRARDESKISGEYYDADSVLSELKDMLNNVRK